MDLFLSLHQGKVHTMWPTTLRSRSAAVPSSEALWVKKTQRNRAAPRSFRTDGAKFTLLGQIRTFGTLWIFPDLWPLTYKAQNLTGSQGKSQFIFVAVTSWGFSCWPVIGRHWKTSLNTWYIFLSYFALFAPDKGSYRFHCSALVHYNNKKGSIYQSIWWSKILCRRSWRIFSSGQPSNEGHRYQHLCPPYLLNPLNYLCSCPKLEDKLGNVKFLPWLIRLIRSCYLLFNGKPLTEQIQCRMMLAC